MSGAVLDTSILAADAALVSELPREVSISVITVGELHAGVLRARTKAESGRRSKRLEAVRRAFDPIPVDLQVAYHFGELLAWARAERRSEKATDLLIAATAAATARTLITRDKSQASLVVAAGLDADLVGTGVSRARAGCSS